MTPSRAGAESQWPERDIHQPSTLRQSPVSLRERRYGTGCHRRDHPFHQPTQPEYDSRLAGGRRKASGSSLFCAGRRGSCRSHLRQACSPAATVERPMVARKDTMNAATPIVQLVVLEKVVCVSTSMRASGGVTEPTNQLVEPVGRRASHPHPPLEPDVQHPKAQR